MNLLHPAIKFTTAREDSQGCIPFLDILLTRHQDDSYSTELYVKDTHSGIVLHFASAHPRRTKVNTLKNELRRARRLSSDTQTANRSASKIKDVFKHNGYPDKLIESTDRQVQAQAQTSTQTPAQGQPSDRTFHEKNDSAFLTLPFVDDTTCKRVEAAVKKSGVPCKVAWTNRGSLKKQLVRSDLRGDKCPISRGKCLPCAAGFDGTCSVNNVVYEVECVMCHSTYIGECIRPVRERFFDHRRAAFRKDPENPVGNHFLTKHSHDVLPETPITGTILIRCRSHVDRKLNETMSIRDRKPGMNVNVSSWWTLDR